MTDDVEETLQSLELRLRALQAELDAEDEPLREAEPAPAPRRFAPAATATPPRVAPATPAAPPTPPVDALAAFGVELRRLVAAWDRTVAAIRSSGADEMTFRGGVALEARGELPALCALDAALRRVDGVTAVNFRAYAGGAAALEVALEREVPLVAELRCSISFDLIAVGDGKLTISLG
jgi:hypothetical protein